MNGPLRGKTVLVTRPRAQSEELASRFRTLGATVHTVPAIDIVPVEDPSGLDAALAILESFDWLILTSVNGVRTVQERLGPNAKHALNQVNVAVIGPATNAALEQVRGRYAEVCPSEYVSEAIAESLGDVSGMRFLLARADLARPELARILRDKGAIVQEAVAYHIVNSLDGELPDHCPDFVTVTSAAAAKAIVERLRDTGRAGWLTNSRFIAIGPIAAASLREQGVVPAQVADVYTSEGIIDALLRDAQEMTHV